MAGRHIELPLGEGRLNVRLRRRQRDFARRKRFQRTDLLRVNDLDREELVVVGLTRQRDEQSVAVRLRFRRLAVHVGGPEFRAARQCELLELFVVVLHHKRCLREHLAHFGYDRGQLRAVGDGFEDFFLR